MRGCRLLEGAHSAALAGVFLALMSPCVAMADTSPANQAAAQALFDQGRRLLDEGKFPEACTKFEASQRLDPGTGTLLNLATCNERVGKLATAWTQFNEALSLAIRDGRRDRMSFAREHIAAIEPHLPRLTISVRAPGTEGLSVTIDGASLGKSAWDVAAPVDPGNHDIEATAPGKLPFRATVKLAPAEARTLEVPALDDDPAALAKVGNAETPAPTQAPPPPATTANAARRLAGEIALGAGVVALGIGTYFGVRAFSIWSNANDNCPKDMCNSMGQSLTEDARAAARGSDVAFGVGIAAVAAGIVLILTSGNGQSAQPTVGASLAAYPQGGGLSLHGAW